MTLMKSSFFGPLLLILLSSSCSSSISSSSTMSEPGSVVSRTYHTIKNPNTWQDAQTYCRKHFTDMAIVYQDADLDNMSLNHYLSWVRLATHTNTFDVQNWTWTTGSDLPFSNLARNEIQDIDRCAILDTETRKVSLTGCGHHFFFHCNWSQLEVLHKNFNFLTTTWREARKTCQNIGNDLMALSAIDDATTSSFPVWIGLRREGDDWKWSSGSSDYRRWGMNGLKSEDCVKISSKNRYMSTRNCYEHFPFVCVSDNLVLVKEKKTWEEALEHCRTMDSQDQSNAQYDLVSVVPGNDQDYIMMSIREAEMEEVWVGLRFLAGTWLWTTGADMLHTDLPRCPSGWRHCGVLSKNNGSSLEARDCDERKYFLCHRKK